MVVVQQGGLQVCKGGGGGLAQWWVESLDTIWFVLLHPQDSLLFPIIGTENNKLACVADRSYLFYLQLFMKVTTT